MLVQKKMSKLKSTVLIAIIAVIFLAIAYLLISNFAPGLLVFNEFLPKNEEVMTASAMPVIDTNLNDEFFKQPVFTSLKQPAVTLPVVADKKGRPNPFEPINF